MPHRKLHNTFHVIRYLPFSLDDIDEVNRCFLEWYRTRNESLRVIIDSWSYCYASRYFTQKFSRENRFEITDCEELVIQAYMRMVSNLQSVRDPERYTNWASVVCKNGFLNYVRSKRVVNTVDADDLVDPSAQPGEYTSDDRRLIFRTISESIDRLPAYMREIGRMRFLQDKSYDEIEAACGRDAKTVRAYAHKALLHLRNDPAIMALGKEFLRDADD